MLKRSQINEIIKESIDFIQAQGFQLPPFAKWTTLDWENKGVEYDNLRQAGLGWDVADYGLDDFAKIGIVALTIRLGSIPTLGYEKPYAEKLLVLQPDQEVPLHFHPNKIEDLINRGTTDCYICFYRAKADGSLDEQPVTILMDGCIKTVAAGQKIVLKPGESVTLLPKQYHKIWAGREKVLLGEVTMVNNDHHFFDVSPSATIIEEDVQPEYYLVNEYPQPTNTVK